MRTLKGLLSILILFNITIYADDLDDAMGGFDDEPSALSESSELDDMDMSGFDDEAEENVSTSSIVQEPEEDPFYTFSGSVSFLGAYNYSQKAPVASPDPRDVTMDFRGLSRARTKLNLNLDMKHGDNWKSRIEVMGFYDASFALHGRDGYSEDVLDAYETFYQTKDVYIQGSLNDSVDLKFGRQVVIWGKSDSIRVTDIINPMDNREPGMVDIEDLRLSETMTKLDYFFGDYALSGIIIHEPRLEIEPAFGSDYRPRDIFGQPIPDSKFPERIEPALSLDNTQFALSLDGRFSGWDLSLYAANVLNSRWGVQFGEPLPNGQKTIESRTYEKIYMTGIATNAVVGSWLLKAEAAYLMDIDYRTTTENKNRLDVLVGADYSGFSKTVLSLELADRYIFDYEPHMVYAFDFAREQSIQGAIRGSYTFDNDNATVTYLLSLLGGNGLGNIIDGGFQRVWIDYKYSDDIQLNAGLVDYIGGDGTIPFYNAIENNDRVFAEIQYSF